VAGLVLVRSLTALTRRCVFVRRERCRHFAPLAWQRPARCFITGRAACLSNQWRDIQRRR